MVIYSKETAKGRHLMLFHTLGPSSLPVMVARPDERYAKRTASVLEWYDRHKAQNNILFKRSSERAFAVFESSCHLLCNSVKWCLAHLPKDTRSELSGLFLNSVPLMLNVKQETVNTNFLNVWSASMRV